jgi:hypothetical protein
MCHLNTSLLFHALLCQTDSDQYLSYVSRHRQEISHLCGLLPYLRLKEGTGGTTDDLDRRQKVMLLILTVHGIVKMIGKIAHGKPQEIK